MIADPLGRAAREAGGRIRAALAARFRDLDLAEDAFAEACGRAAETWPRDGSPRDPVAWLYRVAQRAALDALRRCRVRERLTPDPPEPEPNAEDAMLDDARLIPDERLRLVFVCCHPAVAAEARAALTLRLVCGLPTQEIARAFLLREPALAQRLVRAKRKIAEAGIGFEVPGREAWPERLQAVLSTIEIAYSKAHEDAAGAGAHAGFAAEMIELARVLAGLLPGEPEVLGLAATIHYAEARRPARVDRDGAMIPLSDQDPDLWDRDLIAVADCFLRRGLAAGARRPRVVQAGIHAVWCTRRNGAEPPPWPDVLRLYDALLEARDDPFVRLNRAVALAEVAGVAEALAEIEALPSAMALNCLSFHAVRADLLRRAGQTTQAIEAYDRALALGPAPAERLWLARRRRDLDTE